MVLDPCYMHHNVYSEFETSLSYLPALMCKGRDTFNKLPTLTEFCRCLDYRKVNMDFNLILKDTTLDCKLKSTLSKPNTRMTYKCKAW